MSGRDSRSGCNSVWEGSGKLKLPVKYDISYIECLRRRCRVEQTPSADLAIF